MQENAGGDTVSDTNTPAPVESCDKLMFYPGIFHIYIIVHYWKKFLSDKKGEQR